MTRVLVAFLLLAPLSASAADQTILGTQLLVKNPGAAEKRKIVVKGKEKSSPNTLEGDPTANGATLTVGAEGATPSTGTWALPSGTDPKSGKPFWSGNASKGYRYKDPKGANGPVKLARIKRSSRGVFQVAVVLAGKRAPIEVVPPNPGTAGCAALTLGGGDSYSLRFADGKVTNKGASLFKVTKPGTEGSCVAATTTTTTSSSTTTTLNGLCSNGTLDAGEQCDPPGSSCGAGGGICTLACTCACDFLDPSECMYPFPNDWFTVASDTTDTGRRVHFTTDGMPRNTADVTIEPSDYNRSDGFSPGATIVTRVPNADLAMTGAAPITDVERSLDTDAPVVLVNASTLARHLMWVEIDSNASSEATRSVIVRPAVNLAEGTRYVVAFRNMKDASGALLAPTADFLAYRDDTPTGDPVREARRPHMEDVFSVLAAAGVARNDLYVAWDFTVASERNLTERLLFVRDDGFARLGSAAPAFVVTNVENDVDGNIFRRVTGTFQVERYVDQTTPGARFVLDANGLPTHQAPPQTADFVCNVPRAALANAGATAVPARASLYGHGLLGSHTEVNAGNVRAMANEHNFVFCATKWIGMGDEDIPNALTILQDLSKFPTLTDRLQQGMLNQLFLARLMIHADGLTSHAAFQDASGDPVIDTSDVFYDGNSQGGIFGGTVMAIAQDITRGVLGVPGMNYSLLLTRSIDFDAYSQVLYPAYPNELQRPLILALIQMLWDRSDPNGYAHHITSDPLPNTPPHDVLLHVAFGDHQVANVATEIQARTLGLSIHQPATSPGRHSDVDPYFGIPAIPGYPFDGSAIVIWDSGAATPPITNTPPDVGEDPHSDPRSWPAARQQKSDFLQTGGMVTDACSGTYCIIP